MTLDLAVVSRMFALMGGDLASATQQEDERVQRALAILREHAANFEQLDALTQGAHFAGLTAGLIEPLDRRVPLPAPPDEYTVAASDGSSIEPDRHGAAYYYLMNIGRVVLRYGTQASAQLDSVPTLRYRPEDLYLTVGDREVPLEGGLLRVLRAVAETKALAELIVEEASDRPVLGLQDGNLIPWMPEGHGLDEPELREALLRPLFDSLNELRSRGLPIASYVSRPRSAEVVNLLRLASCPHPSIDCRRLCPRRGPRQPAPCDEIFGITDRRVLSALPLAEGERSAVFYSRSRVKGQYHEDRMHFCYLNVGAEIGRLEMPEWVAEDAAMIDFVHAVVYDQCRRGRGYPRALTEAHEQAVITLAERQQCEYLVESMLARHHILAMPSEKQQSKRLRGV